MIAPHRLDQVLEIDQALSRFSQTNPRHCRVVEMHIFDCLDLQEVAELLQLSVRTVKRDWELSKTWLFESIDKAEK